MKIKKRHILYIIIWLSIVPILLFTLPFAFSGLFTLQDTFWLTGSLSGLLGFMMLFWQYFLGIKSFAYYFTDDIITFVNLHKWIGINGFLLILIHPALLALEFIINRHQLLLRIIPNTTYDLKIIIGEGAFLLVFLMWFTGYLIRKKISFRLWKLIHLLTYIILPAVYIHSDDIGTFFQDQTLKLYIQFITILFVLLCLYKLGKYLGILKYEYSVKNIEQITRDTFKITFKPLSSFIRPKRGQFIEIQSPRFGETHPFTVLSFDEQSGELALGIKSSGKFSTQLSQLKIGNKVYLDGPYGIFTKEAYLASTKKIVLIAGGIGVTPFINFMDYFKDHTQNYDEVAFFFGNKTVEDILFKNEIESIQSPNFIAVNVLSLDKTNHKYENGFINSALIKKYIGDLCDYKFFICGPPIMMQLVKADLIKNSVKTVDIHTEEFSW